MNCVCISHFVPGVALELQTDAINIGISGILYQRDGEERLCIVCSLHVC